MTPKAVLRALHDPHEPLPWMSQALCAEVGGDMFFVDDRGEVAAAKRVCAQCPVIQECLVFALETPVTKGVLGGMSPRQRRRLRAAKKAA